MLKQWLSSFLSLFFPHCCIVCRVPLELGEQFMCTTCNMELPRTNYHRWVDNPIERSFWGKIPIGRATSYFFYYKESHYRRILYDLKYYGKKEVGATMGRYMAAELLSSGFFQGIDVLVPIPLHSKKQKLRGYNQSEWIARGISQMTQIPINTDAIVRQKNTETQTRKSRTDRWTNVDGIFELRDSECFLGKHLLIIDDVLTTGATITACASCLAEVEGVQISVLTLAMASY